MDEGWADSCRSCGLRQKKPFDNWLKLCFVRTWSSVFGDAAVDYLLVATGFENSGAVGSDPVRLLSDALARQGMKAQVHHPPDIVQLLTV